MANYFNWGYSLHIGVSDYSNAKLPHYTFKNLPYPKQDAPKYASALYDLGTNISSDYYYRIQLIDQEATLYNFLKNLIYYASIVEDGDVITITYSGHGLYHLLGKNLWLLYDTYIYDHELYQLLRMINPKVRVNIISDCCEAAGMVDAIPQNSDFIYNRRIVEKVKEVDEQFAQKLSDVIKYCKSGLSFCGITHFSATGNDQVPINDYLSFYRFLEFYLNTYGKIIHNIKDFHKEIREIAFKNYKQHPSVFRSLAFNSQNDHRPYDPSCTDDVDGMLRVLPKMTQQGLFDPIHKNKVAFRV